jgi:hypothetical protein
MNAIAEGYVKLVLAVGQHDAAYVDAYYGPDAWKTDAERQKKPLSQIDAEADRLIRTAGPRPSGGDETISLRHDYLVKQLQALGARAHALGRAKMSFDESARSTMPLRQPIGVSFQAAQRSDPVCRGLAHQRYDAYRQAFIIPKTACRRCSIPRLPRARRTQQHIRCRPAKLQGRVNHQQSWAAGELPRNYHSLIR